MIEFLDRLGRRYKLREQGVKAARNRKQPVLITPAMDWVIQLYHSYAYGNVLPAYGDQGLAAQNPRLILAFRVLSGVDADLRSRNT